MTTARQTIFGLARLGLEQLDNKTQLDGTRVVGFGTLNGEQGAGICKDAVAAFAGCGINIQMGAAEAAPGAAATFKPTDLK
jgi:hypothetical protein